MKRVWDEHKDNLLRRHYPKGDLTALAERLGVTMGAIKSRAAKLGISRKVNVHHPWTERQLRLLQERYADTTMPELIRLLKHGKDSIETKAQALGLRKSREYKAMIARMHPDNGKSSRWQKGHVPANKGKRACEFRSPEAIAKCRQTEFKPGQLPHNTKPVGYERTDKNGYVYVKVEGERKMVPKHRHVYEQHFGPIPAGHNVTFRDGNRRNCDISNLELVSRAECARRKVQSETPEARRRRIGKAQATLRHNDHMDKIRLHWGLPTKGNRIKRW